MRLPRMTTRRWMALVAVAGVTLTGLRFWQLRIDYQHRSEAYAANEEACRSNAEWSKMSASRLARSVGLEERVRAAGATREAEKTLAEYYADLKVKYARAADRPWLSVPPDPP
jgi:hypothetical protein